MKLTIEQVEELKKKNTCSWCKKKVDLKYDTGWGMFGNLWIKTAETNPVLLCNKCAKIFAKTVSKVWKQIKKNSKTKEAL